MPKRCPIDATRSFPAVAFPVFPSLSLSPLHTQHTHRLSAQHRWFEMAVSSGSPLFFLLNALMASSARSTSHDDAGLGRADRAGGASHLGPALLGRQAGGDRDDGLGRGQELGNHADWGVVGEGEGRGRAQRMRVCTPLFLSTPGGGPLLSFILQPASETRRRGGGPRPTPPPPPAPFSRPVYTTLCF